MQKIFKVVNHVLKDEALLADACNFLTANGFVTPKYYQTVVERAKIASLYMGNGLIIPHATTDGRREVLRDGAVLITWFKTPASFEGNTVYFSATLAVNNDEHLDLLSEIAERFLDFESVKNVAQSTNVEEVKSFLGV